MTIRRSANGYPVIETATYTGDMPRLRRFQIPGTSRAIPLRDGTAGFVLTHLAYWYDDTIERLDLGPLDDWGWANRTIAGSTVISNHASGTAEDLNASRHPQHTAPHETFTAEQITRIRKRLARAYDDVIRWGGDYSPEHVDPMHFEIDAPIHDVRVLATRLLATPRGQDICDANPGLRKLIEKSTGAL